MEGKADKNQTNQKKGLSKKNNNKISKQPNFQIPKIYNRGRNFKKQRLEQGRDCPNKSKNPTVSHLKTFIMNQGNYIMNYKKLTKRTTTIADGKSSGHAQNRK